MDYSKIKSYSRPQPRAKHTKRNLFALAFAITIVFSSSVAAMGNDELNRIESPKPVVITQTTAKKIDLSKAPEKPSELNTPKSGELKTTNTPIQPTIAAVSPEPTPVEPTAPTPVIAPEPVKDPNGCEAKGMYWRADNYECIPKPAPAPATVAQTPVTETSSPSPTGSGDCVSEIAKYDWQQSVAIAVATAESGLSTTVVNDTPATGDYSIGCFQINIYGANARNRPSESELMNAATNVAYAYRLYAGNGNSFIGQWGVCRAKVACY